MLTLCSLCTQSSICIPYLPEKFNIFYSDTQIQHGHGDCGHLSFSLCTSDFVLDKLGMMRMTLHGRVIIIYANSIWRRPESLFLTLCFRFSIRLKGHIVKSLWIKFHQDRLIFCGVTMILLNSVWQQPPSWFSMLYFRFCVELVRHVVKNPCVKFHKHR